MRILLFLLLSSTTLSAQTDYDQLTNWYYHPDKAINILANYALDVAVIGKDLQVDSMILIDNRATTNTGIDVFWVHPTQLTNPPASPGVVALSAQPFSIISSTIIAQGALLAKYGRFYAPRYRQATPASFLDASYPDEVRAEALITAYQDVKNAFLHYLNNHNNGNKIILAGHSQGSFLLGMLLRDVFDPSPDLRAKLVTAALGGMPYIHAASGTYIGGQWENIPLCTQPNECGCIHNWRSFKETQTIPALASTLPIFNQAMVDSGLVYRTVDLTKDWFVQDSLVYGAQSSYLRYYIAPDASYTLGQGANFIAFDSLYLARFKRVSNTKLVLAIEYTDEPDDQRPNDLLPVESDLSFLLSGFHQKDYHIYLWALMQQIDAKLNGCAQVTSLFDKHPTPDLLTVFPNPNNGSFTIRTNQPLPSDASFTIIDALGRTIKQGKFAQEFTINISHSGLYFLISPFGNQSIRVN